MLYVKNNLKGFTLIEILVVIGITTILSLGAITMLRDTTFFQGVFQQGLNSVDEGRKILRPLVGEVRSATPAHNGAYALETTDAETLIFYSDIDNDDLIERVRYFIDEGTLKKGVIDPTGSPLGYTGDEQISWVIQDVANGAAPLFEYFDTDYDGTTDSLTQPVTTGDVRLIQITIVIDHDPARPPAAVELTTQMTIRNLKDNL
jgi:prepilin-type N-terminal cleavage/methylation domain-containing protein